MRGTRMKVKYWKWVIRRIFQHPIIRKRAKTHHKHSKTIQTSMNLINQTKHLISQELIQKSWVCLGAIANWTFRILILMMKMQKIKRLINSWKNRFQKYWKILKIMSRRRTKMAFWKSKKLNYLPVMTSIMSLPRKVSSRMYHSKGWIQIYLRVMTSKMSLETLRKMRLKQNRIIKNLFVILMMIKVRNKIWRKRTRSRGWKLTCSLVTILTKTLRTTKRTTKRTFWKKTAMCNLKKGWTI